MMTVPLELPMRANEAAALADLILQMGERQSLTPEVRNRLLSRVPGLGLESLKPYMGSLVKDPTQGGTQLDFGRICEGISGSRRKRCNDEIRREKARSATWAYLRF